MVLVAAAAGSTASGKHFHRLLFTASHCAVIIITSSTGRCMAPTGAVGVDAQMRLFVCDACLYLCTCMYIYYIYYILRQWYVYGHGSFQLATHTPD
jgi:hypothetical protein